MFIDFVMRFTKHGRLKRKVDSIMEKVSKNEKCSVKDFVVMTEFIATIPLAEETLLKHLHTILTVMMLSGQGETTRSKPKSPSRSSKL
jgi:hypothetical protein